MYLRLLTIRCQLFQQRGCFRIRRRRLSAGRVDTLGVIERRIPAIVLNREIGAALGEQNNDLVPALLRGAVQRRLAVVGTSVDVRACL